MTRICDFLHYAPRISRAVAATANCRAKVAWKASMHSGSAMYAAIQATAHNTQLVSGLTCVDGDTPRESCDGDRDFANASVASVESMLPACEFADVLLLLLSLIVPGNERPFRKLSKHRESFRLYKRVAGTVTHTHTHTQCRVRCLTTAFHNIRLDKRQMADLLTFSPHLTPPLSRCSRFINLNLALWTLLGQARRIKCG